MIVESLTGRRIAITGATGFVGTALVERLIRAVPGCELVLVIRPGRRTTAAQRAQKEIIHNDAFDRLRAALAGNGLGLSALAYYDNNLHPDDGLREDIHAHLRACIDAAGELDGVPVGTFVGRDPGRSVSENMRPSISVRIMPMLIVPSQYFSGTGLSHTAFG